MNRRGSLDEADAPPLLSPMSLAGTCSWRHRSIDGGGPMSSPSRAATASEVIIDDAQLRSQQRSSSDAVDASFASSSSFSSFLFASASKRRENYAVCLGASSSCTESAADVRRTKYSASSRPPSHAISEQPMQPPQQPLLQLNIDEVCVNDADGRLPVLSRDDSFAREVLGMIQACEADGTDEEKCACPAVVEFSKSMATLLPPLPSLSGTLGGGGGASAFNMSSSSLLISGSPTPIRSGSLAMAPSATTGFKAPSGRPSLRLNPLAMSMRALLVRDGVIPSSCGDLEVSGGPGVDVEDRPDPLDGEATDLLLNSGSMPAPPPKRPDTARRASSAMMDFAGEVVVEQDLADAGPSRNSSAEGLAAENDDDDEVGDLVSTGSGAGGFIPICKLSSAQRHEIHGTSPRAAEARAEAGARPPAPAAVLLEPEVIVPQLPLPSAAATATATSSPSVSSKTAPAAATGAGGRETRCTLTSVNARLRGFADRSGERPTQRRTLREAEAEEREEIKSLFSELLLNLKWESVQFFDELGHKGASERVQREAEESFTRMWEHRMTTVINLYFPRVFPHGVADTDLTPFDVACIAEAYLAIEPLMTERELTSLGFQRSGGGGGFAAGSAHDVPEHQRPHFFAWASAKCALMMLVEGGVHRYSVGEVRDLVAARFYSNSESPGGGNGAVGRGSNDRRSAAVTGLGLALLPSALSSRVHAEDLAVTAIAHAARLTMARPERSHMAPRLHAVALAAERRLRRTFADPDNTINVEYQKGELCGVGSYGKVYRCLNIANGKFLALKEIPLPVSSEEGEQLIRVEIDTLKSLSHPNVIRYFGCRFDREKHIVSIMMEYAPRSLRDVVTECGGLTLQLIAHYSRQVLRGLDYIHRQSLVHRDLKAANCLVTDGGSVMLADFGCATLVAVPADLGATASAGTAATGAVFGGSSGGDLHELAMSVAGSFTSEMFREERFKARMRFKMQQQQARTRLVGTPAFMCPSLLKGGMPSAATDIYAFGCMLIELVTGKYPWAYELASGSERPSIELLLFHVGRATLPPQLPPHIDAPADFLEFMYAALDLDPEQRPSAHELLQFPFLNGGGGGGAAGACRTPVSDMDSLSSDGPYTGRRAGPEASISGSGLRVPRQLSPTAHRAASSQQQWEGPPRVGIEPVAAAPPDIHGGALRLHVPPIVVRARGGSGTGGGVSGSSGGGGGERIASARGNSSGGGGGVAGEVVPPARAAAATSAAAGSSAPIVASQPLQQRGGARDLDDTLVTGSFILTRRET